jgi:3-phosphoshikimate 1-carboxyvinyltransferase
MMDMKNIRPVSKPLRGSVRVPGDKSIAHRALILGALSEKGLHLSGLPQGQDILSTRHCLEALGASIRSEEGGFSVQGNGILKPWGSPGRDLDCGNSGTTMRLMMGALCGMPLEATLFGDASLSKRPMDRVAEPLREMGADFSLKDGRYAPVLVHGRRCLKPARYRLPLPSAQVKSAILLAGLSAQGETLLEDPFGSRDHTERMLAWLNPALLRREGPEIRLLPGPLPGGISLQIPGDISSAAFFLAAAALIEGSELEIPGVGINPTRLGFMEALLEMGALIEIRNPREEGGEPLADLRIRNAPLKAVTITARRIPALIDELPLLAVVATSARGTTRLEGLGELRLKESDRLEGTARGLLAMGAEALADGEALEIRGPARLQGAQIETSGDHRLAMAFAVAALSAQGETALSEAECTAISYPDFFSDLESFL